MLEKIRQISHHYLFKFFFLILAVAFVISLRDFSSSGTAEVATVGSKNISMQEFLQSQQEVKNQFNEQNVSPEQISNIAIMRLITQSLLQQETENLGIRVSPEVLAEYVRNDSSFHKNGEFDFDVYKKILQHNNINEDLLLKNLSNQVASRFLSDTLAANMPLKKIFNDYLYNHLAEKRIIKLLTVDTNKLILPSLDDQELKNYYQKNQSLFQSKEKRSFSYILLSLNDFEKKATLTEAEVYKEYEKNILEYALPQTRDFDHFLAPSQEIGDKLSVALKTNQDSKSVAKSFIEDKVITESFNNQSQTSFIANIDPSLFQLKEGEITNAIKSDLGWHVFKVTKIHSSKYQDFAKVKADVEKKLRHKLAEQQLYEVSKQIDDDIASGSDLSDISKRYDLKLSHAKETSGNDPITVIAFQTDLNEISQITQIYNSQDYVIVKTESIIPSKTQDYAEVMDQVRELYSLQLKGDISAKLTKALKAFYEKDPKGLMNESMINSAAIKNILQPIYDKYGINPQLPSGQVVISLSTQELSNPKLVGNQDLSPGFINDLFSLKLGKASITEAIDSTKYGFAIVTKLITDTKLDPQVSKYIDTMSESNYKNALYDQYLAYLKEQYKVKINFNLIKNQSE